MEGSGEAVGKGEKEWGEEIELSTHGCGTVSVWQMYNKLFKNLYEVLPESSKKE